MPLSGATTPGKHFLISFGLRGRSPQAFTSFGRVAFIARRLRRPKKGNADGAEGIFGTCRMRVGYGLAPGPTIKRPCAILARSVGRATNTATTPGQTGPGSDGNEGCTPHSPKLQHCWNLTIRSFSVISRTLVGGGAYPSTASADRVRKLNKYSI